MLGFDSVFGQLFGTHNGRMLKTQSGLVKAINAMEPEISALSDEEIQAKTPAFKARLEQGATLDDLLVEAFAVVREAALRTLGLRAYDVQLLGGIFLHKGNISEMKTGEGKTLAGVFPVYLNALMGKGVHVVTVNDYLARRDAEWMGQVYSFLGMETGVAVPNMSETDKRAAYLADVTYATNNELGFDYLRDNMKSDLSQMMQREHFYAIVDEVDSILIDEARTPLVISGQAEDRSELYTTLNALIPKLTEDHYILDEKSRSVNLTDEGNDFIEAALLEMGVLPEGQSLYDPESTSVVHHINNGLRAHTLYKKDQNYIVRDNKVVLIDEFTGRMMAGRRMGDGLHQAVEAKEGVEILPENSTLASITFQNYFRLYDKLAGMTGTAQTEAEEFGQIYGLGVVEIPTNQPICRIDDDDAIYRTAAEKYRTVICEIAKAHLKGQPILVGTVSIEKSEYLSELLKKPAELKRMAKELRTLAETYKEKEATPFIEDATALETLAQQKNGIPHHVLNARFHEQEASIVANAGVSGAVTIATNMAGRGTDIQLGGNFDMRLRAEIGDKKNVDETALAESIKADIAQDKEKALQAGGLYVLATERHESRRIDNQLRGRSGRQGDPGRSAFLLSLEDDLMRIFGSTKLDSMLGRLGMVEGEAITHPWVNKSLEKAQAKVESRNFDIRKQLLKFDDVMNDQRKVIFEQRRTIMQVENLSEIVKDMRYEVIDDILDDTIPVGGYVEQWDVDSMQTQLRDTFRVDFPIEEWVKQEGMNEDDLREKIAHQADEMMARKAVDIGADDMRNAEKHFLLRTIDLKWREHLLSLEHLRSVVGMRGYAQRDPLNEYKTEAFALFETMLDSLRADLTRTLAIVRRPTPEEQQEMMRRQMEETGDLEGEARLGESGGESGADTPNPHLENKKKFAGVGRNDKCPCDSGKKFKHCHGRL